MDRITLQWKQTAFSKLDTEEDGYFYAISRGSNLLYVGNTQLQHIKERLSQHIARKFNHETRGLTLWLAEIKGKNFDISSGNIAHVIHAVESLLIFKNQPSKNHHCKVNYTGKMEIRVLSHGCPVLIPKIEGSPK